VISNDLIFAGDIMPAFLGIACDDGAGNREFNAKKEFDRIIDNCIKAEALLFAIWMLRVSPDPNPGIRVKGEVWTSKGE